MTKFLFFQYPSQYPGIPENYASALQHFYTKMPQTMQKYQVSSFDWVDRYYPRRCCFKEVFLSLEAVAPKGVTKWGGHGAPYMCFVALVK